jgi:hypothetical protein
VHDEQAQPISWAKTFEAAEVARRVALLERDVRELIVVNRDVLVLADCVDFILLFALDDAAVTASTIWSFRRLLVARLRVLNRTFSEDDVAG